MTPGNYGEAYLKEEFSALAPITVKCSNFFGETLDNAVSLGFERILLVGHAGKLIKLAGGIMNTHSSHADARMELIAVHAALCGADTDTVRMLVDCVTTDEGIALLNRWGLLEPVIESLMRKITLPYQAAGGRGHMDRGAHVQ